MITVIVLNVGITTHITKDTTEREKYEKYHKYLPSEQFSHFITSAGLQNTIEHPPQTY